VIENADENDTGITLIDHDIACEAGAALESESVYTPLELTEDDPPEPIDPASLEAPADLTVEPPAPSQAPVTAQELTYTVEHWPQYGKWMLRRSNGTADWYGSEAAARAQIPPAGPGAAYQPGMDWTNGGQLDLSSWRDPREMRTCETSHDAVEAMPVVIQLDPLVQAPPLNTDPTYGQFIWRWYAAQSGAICKKTGKPWSAAQRQRFKREAESYLVDVSPAEAALRWDAMNRPRAASSSPSHLRTAQKRTKTPRVPQQRLNL
jgi:hypothetical protein